MATITTNTFLDGGVARTAGENWTVSGCALTIRTDTRWHANAPAGMTGSLGSVAGEAGAGPCSLVIDATKVRWLPFDTGSGTVPEIGTTVTQGDTSGYLLGVWDSTLQAAPLSPSATMPATGFLKFREVSGAFSAGMLTGIDVNALGPDKLGWIELALDNSKSLSISSIGSAISRGGWFSLGSTTGVRGQTVQVPTNGGGATTHVFGIQIETAPGSEVYEWFPTTTTAQGWTTANMYTDARAKFVESMGNGTVRIGSDGTADIGYCPPAGCRIRIPNIFMRSVASSSRAVNQAPPTTTSPRFAIGAGSGMIDFQNVHADSYLALMDMMAVKIEDCVFEGYVNNLRNNLNRALFKNTLFTALMGGGQIVFGLANSSKGADVYNCKVATPGSSGSTVVIGAPTTKIDGLECVTAKARTSSTVGIQVIGNNIEMNNIRIKGMTMQVLRADKVKITNYDYCDRVSGLTSTAASQGGIQIDSSANVELNGFTFGENGTLPESHCYGPVFYVHQCTGSIKIRNAGSRTNPINCGVSASLYPQYICYMLTASDNVKFQRLYFTGARSGLISSPDSGAKHVYGTLFENCAANFSASYAIQGSETQQRGCAGQPSNASNTSSTGIHWNDMFTSDTAGCIQWLGTAPTVNTAPLNYIVEGSSSKAFYNFGGSDVKLPVIGDSFITEMSYFAKGHTGFQNAAPNVSMTALYTMQYQIDKGDGWNGTWKTLNGPTLAAETGIDPVIGVKLKVKVTATSAGMYAGRINILTTSTITAQENATYPLDFATLSFEGLVPGSEVRAYVGSLDDPENAVEIGGVESVVGSTWSFQHAAAGQDGYIMIFAMGYKPVVIPRTYQATDSSLLIQPVVDRNYSNPV